MVLAQDLAELTDEFALVDEAAAEAGRAGRAAAGPPELGQRPGRRPHQRRHLG